MKLHQNRLSAQTAKQRLQLNKSLTEYQPVEVIRQQLPEADPSTRLKLVVMLDRIGTDAALATLADLLPDADPDVHQAVASVLCRPHPRYTQMLTEIALKASLDRRIAALEVIAGHLSVHHLPILVACLDVEQPAILQQTAAAILHAMQTPEAYAEATKWKQAQAEPDTPAPNAPDAPDAPDAVPASSSLVLVQVAARQEVVNYRHSFASLIKHVRAGNWGDQQDAAQAVHRLVRAICGDPSADYRAIRQDFIHALDDPEQMVRWVVIEALWRLGDPEVIPAVLARLDDPSWTVRVAVIQGLIEIGDVSVVKRLTRMFTDPNPNVQEAAIEAVGLLGTLQEVPLLMAVVEGKSSEMVRIAAIAAIHRLRGSLAVPTLLKRLDDPNPLIRWHAAKALSDLADETSVSTLTRYLHDQTHPRWEQKGVCDWLIDALERINTPVSRVAVKMWYQSKALDD